MDRSGLAQGIGRHLGQADRADLALLDQVRQRADQILDRHGEIAAVQIVEVDVVGLEQLERDFQFAADGIGVAIDAALFAADENAHLRGERNLVATRPLSALADLRLVVAHAIKPRGIEVVVAEIERMVEQARTILVAGRLAVGPAQRHAAKADGVEGAASVDRAALNRHGVSPDRRRRCQREPQRSIASAAHSNGAAPVKRRRRRRSGITGAAALRHPG